MQTVAVVLAGIAAANLLAAAVAATLNLRTQGLRGYRPWQHEIARTWSPDFGLRLSLAPRRKPGSPADVAAFRAALARLEGLSTQDAKAAEWAADQLGLSGQPRRNYLAGIPESDAWLAANTAVAAAELQISPRQERAARNDQDDSLAHDLISAAILTALIVLTVRTLLT